MLYQPTGCLRIFRLLLLHKMLETPAAVPIRILTEHSEGRISAQDAGLGNERASGVVMIQIFTQAGRPQDAKQRLFAAVAEKLAEAGIAGEDVSIGYVENAAGGWSFGFGRAQCVTGELAVPRK